METERLLDMRPFPVPTPDGAAGGNLHKKAAVGKAAAILK
jgi:hypothetical protein